ncbi:MAG: hypothetical protein RIS94_313 [Pseudomonadota bacterium]|jgi:hypothetical protein
MDRHPIGKLARILSARKAAVAAVAAGSAAALSWHVPADAAPRCAAGQDSSFPVRMLNGLEGQRLDATHVVIYPGSAVDNTSCALLNVYRTMTLDIEAKGAGGRDDVLTPDDLETTGATSAPAAAAGTAGVAAPRVGASYRGGAYAGKPLAGWYYVVLAREQRPDAPVTAMLTRQQSSQRTDQPGSAGVPANFVYRRHLPMAFYYDPASGFRPFNCYGWPKPFCEWTRVLPRENYQIVQGVSAPTPHAIDASAWLPGYGRMLRMEVVVHGAHGGGSAYISTLGRSEGEFLGGTVNRAGDMSVMQVEIAATSKATFSVRTDPGVTVDIYAVGFSIAQPS